jgi:O-antigen/teichoic acid export membrane protein
MYLWSGNSILATHTAPILLPLVIGTFLNCLVWMPYQAQLAYGWTRFGIRVNTIALLVLVPAIFWVAPRYGAIGAAWLWTLLNFGYVTIGMQFMYKKLLSEEKWSWYWNDIAKQLITAIIVMVILRPIISWATDSPLTKILIYVFGLCLAICLTSMQSAHIRPLLFLMLDKFLKKK